MNLSETISRIIVSLSEIEIKAKQSKQMNGILDALYAIKIELDKGKEDE